MCATHFAAYSFVDRIAEFEPGRRARAARSRCRRRSPHFPSCLVAEAVGQLAAWVAMDAHRLSRPAGRGARDRDAVSRRRRSPGSTLELAVDDRRVRRRSGRVQRPRAASTAATSIELVDCLGPMLPVADFDSPDALRERLRAAARRRRAARPFRGVRRCRAVVTHDATPASRCCATLDVPASAPFFADHFPRRPVFPATLLLDTQIRLALDARRAKRRRLHGATPRADARDARQDALVHRAVAAARARRRARAGRSTASRRRCCGADRRPIGRAARASSSRAWR